MKRNFPPVKRDALDGWNQCLDLRPQQIKSALLSIDEFRTILASDDSEEDDVEASKPGPVKKVVNWLLENPRKQRKIKNEPR
jgi:hypothetical protein